MINLSRKLIGNFYLYNTLIDNFKKKKLSHSMIFYGPKGVGKSTFSFFLINNIFNFLQKNMKNTNHENLIYNKSHPNVRYIEKEYDNKKNKFKNYINIDQIRILDNFIYQSSLDNFPKFIIIDSADDLNKNSSNAILKILEEPKNNTFFILIVHQLSNLPPTLRSRCIKFYIQKPNFKKFKEIIELEKKEIINDDQILFLYNLTNGSPGITLEIISNNISDAYKAIFDIFNVNEPLSLEVSNLVKLVSNYSNEQFKIFLMILRYILIKMIKINIGVDIDDNSDSNFNNMFQYIPNQIKSFTFLQILEYLNNNENDLFVYNLDKKLFTLNIFTPLN